MRLDSQYLGLIQPTSYFVAGSMTVDDIQMRRRSGCRPMMNRLTHIADVLPLFKSLNFQQLNTPDRLPAPALLPASGYSFRWCHAVLWVCLSVGHGCGENEACDPVLIALQRGLVYTIPGAGSGAVPGTADFLVQYLY